MDLRVSYGLSNTLYGPAIPRPQVRKDSGDSAPVPAVLSTGKFNQSQTRLIDETNEDTDSGVRRTKTFEQEGGRRFTRVEEISLTESGARRAVIQQNPSGNITRYEEILDREQGGNFRRTQRFQDEGGDVATQITPGYKVTDPFILTGGYVPASNTERSPFNPLRGTQLDLQA